MPHYDYRCTECGDFTVEQPITQDALKICPTCGNPIQRIIGKNVSIMYKTGGFYCTDKGACKSCSACR